MSRQSIREWRHLIRTLPFLLALMLMLLYQAEPWQVSAVVFGWAVGICYGVLFPGSDDA